MNPSRELLAKVPAITAFFWIIKILATTVGETFADLLNESLGLGLSGTSLLMGILLIVVISGQFAMKRYVPVVYWLAIVFISVAGTLITDTMTDTYEIPLVVSSLIFAVLLAMTFAVWFAREKTLAMTSIVTPVREGFYWLAILFTFALGTAVGDLVAETLGLGYGYSAIAYGLSIVFVWFAWRKEWIGSVAAFWISYVLTRPLGASFGDFLSQSADYGGLGWGPETTSYIFLSAIIAIVLYLSVSKRDVLRV